MFQLSCRKVLFNDMQDTVTHYPFRRGKVADPHLNNPPLFVIELGRIPQGTIFGHINDVRLPVVCLHLFVHPICLVVLQRKKVQLGRANAVNDSFTFKPPAVFLLVQAECFVLEGIDNLPLFVRSRFFNSWWCLDHDFRACPPRHTGSSDIEKTKRPSISPTGKIEGFRATSGVAKKTFKFPSCLWRNSCLDPSAEDLMSIKKQVF